MKTVRLIILIVWALLAIVLIATPFIPAVSLCVKICAAIIGLANLWTIFANIRLVVKLNELEDIFKEDK